MLKRLFYTHPQCKRYPPSSCTLACRLCSQGRRDLGCRRHAAIHDRRVRHLDSLRARLVLGLSFLPLLLALLEALLDPLSLLRGRQLLLGDAEMLVDDPRLLEQVIARVLEPQGLDDVAVALALVHLLVGVLAAGDHLAQQVLCVAPAVLDLQRELHVLGDDRLPLRLPLVRAAFCVGAEAGRVLLGFGGDHGAVDAELAHELQRLGARGHVAVHDARDACFAADVADHAQLAADGALAGPHGRGAAVDGEAGDAGPDQALDEGARVGRVVEDADLDADADLVGLADVLDEGREDVDEQVGRLEQGGAHAAGGAEGLGTPGVDVDACHVGGDHLGGLDGALGVRGAHLVDQPALLELRVDAVEHRLAVLRVEVRVLELRRRQPRPLERVGVRVEAPRGADDGAVDRLGACSASASRRMPVSRMLVPHTRSAPYFSASSREGSSPERTMGARTTQPR
jgi:hypothetical protein